MDYSGAIPTHRAAFSNSRYRSLSCHFYLLNIRGSGLSTASEMSALMIMLVNSVPVYTVTYTLMVPPPSEPSHGRMLRHCREHVGNSVSGLADSRPSFSPTAVHQSVLKNKRGLPSEKKNIHKYELEATGRCLPCPEAGERREEAG
jgi:hypothetical protein